MSRRPGQDGSKEFKEGGWWKFRLWKDVPGQEKRAHLSIRICRVDGPEALNASQRTARKRELIAESDVNSKQKFDEVVNSVTFAQQSVIMITELKARIKDPVVEETLRIYQSRLDLHLLPVLGGMHLSEIFSPQLHLVVSKMEKEGYAPASIEVIIKLAKQVVASAIDKRTSEPIYKRDWNYRAIDAPTVDPDKQNRPIFTSEVLTKLAAHPDPTYRGIFILSGASGPRIAEVLGLEIDKHVSSDFRTYEICQQARNGKVLDRVKARASARYVDVHSDIAAVMKELVGERREGFIFAAPNGKPIRYQDVLEELHKALEAIGYRNSKCASGKAGAHAIRRARLTYLKNKTKCPNGIRHYWMGHKPLKGDMDELYDLAKEDREIRLEWAERCGYGFDLPKVVPARASCTVCTGPKAE